VEALAGKRIGLTRDEILKLTKLPDNVVSLVKRSLYAYLKYKDIIHSRSFDEQTREDVSMVDIDSQKVRAFVHQARMKRGFPLLEDEEPEMVLQHLRL
jgi:hypothetical protein